MAFDAAMARAVVNEMKKSAVGAKVEKVFQPTKDETVLFCRAGRQNIKLLLSANPSNARVCETSVDKENPKTPPMFCMLLRKHLVGTVIEDVYMYGFDRVIEIKFSAYDDLGFPCEKYLTAEVMGKCSNLFLLGGEGEKKKIIGLLHHADITMNARRSVLPGMAYELPPSQNKSDPTTETEDGFYAKISAYPRERSADKFIIDTYGGISPLLARECVARAGGAAKTVGEISPRLLWSAFGGVIADINANDFTPCVAVVDGKPCEYSMTRLTQYGAAAKILTFPTFSEMFDFYFGKREQAEMMRAKARDVDVIISNARHKLSKKLPLLKDELAECDKADGFKLWGDLITASVYKLTKKAEYCDVVNYYSDALETVRIPLDVKLTPSQNAERYYKKYTKYKTARSILSEQIKKAEGELFYLQSVENALTLAETESDLAEIRLELALAGYAQKNAQLTKAAQKAKMTPKYFITSGGYECAVGKNNVQNDFITFKASKKSDWWFHVKNSPGSHVVMTCAADEEPDARDFTEAAELAAYFSTLRESENVAVDYTRIKNVKKPPGSVPGYVTYSSNYTAYVDPKCSCKAK